MAVPVIGNSKEEEVKYLRGMISPFGFLSRGFAFKAAPSKVQWYAMYKYRT